MTRRYAAELIGTGLLVFFGAGMATISFGFRAFGSSVAAGILLTGLAFGLVLLGLIPIIGPISGCHVNPAVSLGVCLARRMTPLDMVGYWIAQMIGGLLGALLLWAVLVNSPFYSRSRIGLGANGYDRLSLLHSNTGGTFLTEVILTAVLVLTVLGATRRGASPAAAGYAIPLLFGLVIMLGIPVDGASVNPARSFGPAIVVGGLPLSQLWLFLVAPLVGAILAAVVYMLFGQAYENAAGRAQPAMTMAGAEEGVPAAAGERVTTGTPEMPPGTQRVVSGGGATQGTWPAGQGPGSGEQPPDVPRGGASSTPPEGSRLKPSPQRAGVVRRSCSESGRYHRAIPAVAAQQWTRPLGTDCHGAGLQHGVAGLDGRQRRVAENRPAAECLAWRIAVDSHRLHPDAGRSDPAGRLARGPGRPAQGVPDRCRLVRAGFGAVRACS
jgi:aquaporin Z